MFAQRCRVLQLAWPNSFEFLCDLTRSPHRLPNPPLDSNTHAWLRLAVFPSPNRQQFVLWTCCVAGIIFPDIIFPWQAFESITVLLQIDSQAVTCQGVYVIAMNRLSISQRMITKPCVGTLGTRYFS